jgi:hypothetical protein
VLHELHCGPIRSSIIVSGLMLLHEEVLDLMVYRVSLDFVDPFVLVKNENWVRIPLAAESTKP